MLFGRRNALAWLQRQADNGSVLAAYQLGWQLYETAYSGDPPRAERLRREERGRRYLRMAADGGHLAAAAMLGRKLAHLEETRHEAVRYLRMAADEGDPDATFTLASVMLRIINPHAFWLPFSVDVPEPSGPPDTARVMLVDGVGALRIPGFLDEGGKYREVIDCLRLAADRGSHRAASDLGKMLLVDGRRPADAERCLRIAATNAYDPYDKAELAALLARDGRYAEAERHYRAALDVLPKDTPSEVPYWQAELGRLLQRRGATAEANSLFQRANRAWEKRLRTRGHYLDH